MKERQEIGRREVSHGADTGLQRVIRFNGVVMAANVAFDPDRRISAHAIFNQVTSPTGSFTFPARFYIVFSVVGLSEGEHKVSANQTGAWTMESDEITVHPVLDTVMAVVPVRQSTISGYGTFPLRLTIDGKAYDTGVTLSMVNAQPGGEEQSAS